MVTMQGGVFGAVASSVEILAALEPAALQRDQFEAAVLRLEAQGHIMRPVDIAPLWELGTMLYRSALVVERAAAVGDAVAKGVVGLDPVVAGIIARGADFGAVDAYRTEYELAERRHAALAVWDTSTSSPSPSCPTCPP